MNNLQEEVELSRAFFKGFWREWPELIDAEADTLPESETSAFSPREVAQRDIIYNCFPFLFACDYPAVPLATMRKLARAAYLYALHLFLSDSILDEPRFVSTTLLRSDLFHEEALQMLHQLFPTTSPFWAQYKVYLHAYLYALQLEKRWRSQSLRGFDLPEAEEIASGKAALALATVSALAILSGESLTEERHTLLLKSLKLAHIGLQFYDDLLDWKADLLSQQPSFLLAELLRLKGWTAYPVEREQRVACIADLRQLLYRSELAAACAGRAGGYFRAAQEVLRELLPRQQMPYSQITWRRVLDDCYDTVTELERDLLRALPIQTKAVQPEREAPLASMRERALAYITSQQQEDGRWSDFTFDIGHSTDWLSGYVAQALLPYDECLPQLKKAACYLGETCVNGGWGYNRRAPREADSTAHCALFLLEVRERVEGQLMLRTCLETVSCYLREYQHANGGFSAYRVHSQAGGFVHLVEDSWLQTHPEVTAACGRYFLLSEALSLSVERALASLLTNQASDGAWYAYWYEGPYYGTAQVLRFIAQATKSGWSHSTLGQALERACTFLLKTQRTDGGWSLRGQVQEAAQALPTALAMQSLLAALSAFSQLPPEHRLTASHYERLAGETMTQVYRGSAWLGRHQAGDGSWLPSYILRLPPPGCSDPWLRPFPSSARGTIDCATCDQQRLFTTSTIVQMFTALQAQEHLKRITL